VLLGAVVTPTRRSSNTRSSVILPTRCGLCKRDIPGSRVVMGRERHFAFLHLFPRSSPHNGFIIIIIRFWCFYKSWRDLHTRRRACRALPHVSPEFVTPRGALR